MTFHPILKLLLILLGIFFVSSCVRMGWIAQHQLALAHQSLHQQQQQRALVHYERAIHPYMPLWGARRTAITEMIRLCRTLEQKDQNMLALEGWRRLRAALLSSRNLFGQPDTAILQQANVRIAKLAADTDTQAMMSKKHIQAEDMQLLKQHPKDVHRFWGVAQFIFLLFWAGLTCQLIWKWNQWAVPRRISQAAAIAACWLAWLGSLYLAG